MNEHEPKSATSEVSNIGDIIEIENVEGKIEVTFSEKFSFTQDWFSKNLCVWVPLLQKYKPKRILEIGSFEGYSTVCLAHLILGWGGGEIHCLDTWEGSVEHKDMNFSDIEERFKKNMNVLVEHVPDGLEILMHKGKSIKTLSKLVALDTPQFDLIYIDGSHLATDTLADAVLAFPLLKVGGLMIFDDYNSPNPYTPDFPKVGIDAFCVTYKNHLQRFDFRDMATGEPIEKELEDGKRRQFYQLYLMKVSE